MEVEFHVQKVQEMLDIIADLETTFHAIESFDYITVLSEEKHIYMPDVSLPLSK